MSETRRRTPLYPIHLALGARFTAFGEWELPLQFGSILAEHRAVRTAAGIFDVSHMGQILFEGPQSLALLDHLGTNDLSRLRVGRAAYTIFCRESGGAIDDLILYRLDQHRLLACVNAANTAKVLAWAAEEQARGFHCEVSDQSTHYGLLALQGPRAAAILEEAGVPEAAALPRFGCAPLSVLGLPCLVARTGYTGEDGFEIYCSSPRTPELGTGLLEAGAPLGLVWCGLGARDSLRLEAGLPLYGHELSEEINPLRAGLGFAVKLGKPAGFVGREALRRESEAGLPQRVVYFRLADRRIARPGAPVRGAEREVGRVLSGTLSPMTEGAIGSALIETAALSAPANLEVEVRGARIPLELARPPLHKSLPA